MRYPRRARTYHRPNAVNLPLAAALVLSAVGCAANRPGVIRVLPTPVTRTLPPPPVARPPRPMAQIIPRPIIRETPASAWQPAGGISNRWRAIVIHHSGGDSGNAEQFDRYHRDVNHWDELGYHFVIGNGFGSGDGVIEVGSRWIKQKHGAHCKTPDNYYNDHGIGICLVGDFRASAPTTAQWVSLTRLVRYLCGVCRIPPQNVVSHGEVTGKTVCPGPRFPLYALRRAIQAPSGASVLP